MYALIDRRYVVIYPMTTMPPESAIAGPLGAGEFPVFSAVSAAEFLAFDEECRLRRAEFDDMCLLKPDEEFVALRRAPECPTSRYCLDDCCG